MWFRRRTDTDFQSEIESHIQLEADRLIAEGTPPAEAQAAARRAFGNVTLAREHFYESHRWQWLEQLRQDLRYGLRSLRKSPAFTLAAALTIALGVGANTAVFSLVDAVLLHSLPVHQPKELVFVEAAGSAGGSGAPSYPCFERLRAETHSFTGQAAFATDELSIEIDGIPEQVMGQVASGNYFELLGVKPALGRLMVPGDEKLDPPTAVISDRYWRRRFGADPGIIGRTIYFHQQSFTVIGVTPPEFWGLQPGSPIDVTLPITLVRKLLTDPESRWFQIVARLNPGASATQARVEADHVFQSFMSGSSHPPYVISKHLHHIELSSAAHGMDVLRRRFSKPLYALMAIVGLVLLLATANIANLLLARGIARSREFSIRLAAGAGRPRLVRQLITETLLLFACGAIPGIAFAAWGVGIIEGVFAQGRRVIVLQADLNWRVLGFTLAVTLVAGLLAGLFPAWRAFRSHRSQGATTLTRGLVAFQVALSLVLLVGALTFLQTLANLRRIDPGFHNEDVLTMSVRIPDGYARSANPGEFWSRVLRAVREIPSLRTAGLATYTPLSGRDNRGAVNVHGYQPATLEDSIIHINQISEGYIETLGIPLVRGRSLTAADALGAPRVALINEAAAQKYFPGRDPIGQQFDFGNKGREPAPYAIVGVVRDTRHLSLREPAPRFAYLPVRQPKDADARVTLAVASAIPVGHNALLQPIRAKLAAIHPGILISDVITLRTQLDSTLLTERLLSGLSTTFGALALLLAAVGLYGLLSYRIGQQRRSIGIRVALGATPGSVARNVLRESASIVAAGLLAGLPLAFLAARTAGSMLWDVKPSDPFIYLAGVALLCVVAFFSAYPPARRASTIAPSEALRHT